MTGKDEKKGRVRDMVVGRVSSDKMDKTITVKVERRVQHPVYGKFLKKYTSYKAHDETNDAKTGDLVEIRATRPLSKTKRWRLIRVLERTVL